MIFWSWGVPIELDGPREVVRELRGRLPRGRGGIPRLGDPARFRWSGQSWMRGREGTPDLEKAIELEVATRAPEHIFLHAGVVRFGARALLLPGSSLAGKSTLVRELTRRGGVYYSDEFAVLDAEGRVEAYPRPLSLRTGERIPAREMGWTPRLLAVPVGWVLDLRYSQESVSLAPLSRAQAVLALFSHAVAARSRPAEILSLLGRTVARAGAAQGLRGEAAEAADWILEWLGKEDATWQTIPRSAKVAEAATQLAT